MQQRQRQVEQRIAHADTQAQHSRDWNATAGLLERHRGRGVVTATALQSPRHAQRFKLEPQRRSFRANVR